MAVNNRKVAVVGLGFVGSASAFALMQSGLFSEMVLVNRDMSKAEGEALDISHGLPFAKPMKIYAGTYDDIVDAAVIVITSGAGQKPGETRLDLVRKNVEVYRSIIPEIAKRNCEGILLIVSNPVDILTSAAVKLSGFPENRVFGSGTVLDTARLILIFNKTLQNPFSPGDALNDSFGKIMNDITKTINHVGKSIKDFIFEPTFSEFLPNLLNGIHFRGVRWYME